MDTPAFLDALAREGEALAVAAEAADPAAPVPSCPAWTVADLVWHAGEVLWFWTDVAEHRWAQPDAYEEPDRPADDEVVAWFRSAVGRAHRVLSAADPAAAAWSWSSAGGTVGWIVRRMAQETAVHRWDAEAAIAAGASAGRPRPIDAALASDGIDEFLANFTGTPKEGAEAVGGSVHLHCTDVDGEWLVTEPDRSGPLAFVREHVKGDVAVRGPASDLLLALWRRQPLAGPDPGGLEVIGDPSVAERLVARADLD